MDGLEIFWSSIERDFVSKGDALVALTHWLFISSGYRCLGTGENFAPTDDSAKGSELLPRNWNQDQTGYVSRYTSRVSETPIDSQPKKLVVKIILVGNNYLVTVFQIPGEKSAEMSLNPDDYLTSGYHRFDSAFKSNSSLMQLKQHFTENIINSLNANSGAHNSQTTERRREEENRQRQYHEEPRRPEPVADPWREDLRVPSRGYPPRVGGADLDPFNRGMGGGMIMDPRDLWNTGGPRFNPNGGLPGRPLPPGAVPPGARFDPFGPPGVGPRPGPRGGRGPNPGRFSGPDPDHMRPPGPPDGYDDMFM